MSDDRFTEYRTGNTLTSCSSRAVTLYNNAIELILGSESGAAEKLDNALELDHEFALAAAAGYFVEKENRGSNATAYRTLARESAVSASDWEREHIAVLLGLIDEAGETLDKALAYVQRNPGDFFVISQIVGHLFFFGGPDKLKSVLNLLESVKHVLENDWAYLPRLGFAITWQVAKQQSWAKTSGNILSASGQ